MLKPFKKIEIDDLALSVGSLCQSDKMSISKADYSEVQPDLNMGGIVVKFFEPEDIFLSQKYQTRHLFYPRNVSGSVSFEVSHGDTDSDELVVNIPVYSPRQTAGIGPISDYYKIPPVDSVSVKMVGILPSELIKKASLIFFAIFLVSFSLFAFNGVLIIHPLLSFFGIIVTPLFYWMGKVAEKNA